MTTIEAREEKVKPMTVEVMSRATFLEQAEHTLLKPETTLSKLERFLQEATKLAVKRVCVSPSLVAATAQWMQRNQTEPMGIVSVVGFPSGAHLAEIKAAETHSAVRDGATEIDMVINRGLLGNWTALANEILQVKHACGQAPLKVILETAALNDQEIIDACEAAERGNADFVKTSTGFDPAGGASVHAIELMHATVGNRLGIKASGGIKNFDTVQALARAGATRFGVSGTATILDDWPQSDV